jgi:Leucine-rich repeat (LRR) protein
MYKQILIILLSFLLFGCIAKKEEINNNQMTINEPVTIQKSLQKFFIDPKYLDDGRASISQYHLDNIDLSKPASLKEISDRLTDDNRNNIAFISIHNGENINRLDGIELFPALEYLDIDDSQIQNFNDIQTENIKLRSLFINSNVMNDVSNIVLFKNITSLDLIGSDKIESFPDITHLTKLRALSLSNFKGINISNLADKLPLRIQMMRLRDCNIKSLNDIANLFEINIKLFDLSNNLIREIDFDMDYGQASYIYMNGCPIGEKYFKWDESYSEEYPGYVKNSKGVIFDFGYIQDEIWVINVNE